MKRFLALVIAVMLIGGVLPTSFAAETDLDNAAYNEYIFNAASHGVEVTDETPFVQMTTDNCGLEATVVGDKWAYVNDLSANKRDVGKEYLRLKHLVSKDDSTARPADFDASDNTNLYSGLVLELFVDVEGKVAPSITYKTSTSGMKNDIFLIKKPSNTTYWTSTTSKTRRQTVFNYVTAHPEERLGTIDAYGDTVEIKTTSFAERIVETGSYYLIILPNGANENWTIEQLGSRYVGSLDLKSFMLSEAAGAKEAFYNYDITTNALIDTWQTDTGLASIANSDNRLVTYEGTSPLIDTSKTDEFALYGRNYKLDTSPTLTTNGFVSYFKVGTHDATTNTDTFNYGNELGTRPFFIIKINVPYSGRYDIKALNAFTAETAKAQFSTRAAIEENSVKNATVTTVHIAKVTKDVEYEIKSTNYYAKNTGELGFSDDTVIGSFDSRQLATDAEAPVINKIASKDLAAGEYYLYFDCDATAQSANSSYTTYKSVTLEQIFILSGIQLTLVEDTEQAKVQKVYDDIVDAKTSAVATEKTENRVTTNSVVAYMAYTDKADTPDITSTAITANGSQYSVVAPDAPEGYKFHYWAKGLATKDKHGKALANAASSFTFTPGTGVNYLIAVYKPIDETEATSAKFYNANGDLVDTVTDAIFTAPELPAVAGRNPSPYWVCYETGEQVKAGETITLDGEMNFVAHVEDTFTTAEVVVVNGTSGAGTYNYGDAVTVTTGARSSDGKLLFNYWTKKASDGKVSIVSFDESYTFNVWEDCTLTAVYGEYQPSETLALEVRKIILNKFTVGGNEAVMAEFIGIDDAVEKGIIFGGSTLASGKKLPMTTDGDLFTAVNDEDATTVTGYAILSNGNVIYSE